MAEVEERSRESYCREDILTGMHVGQQGESNMREVPCLTVKSIVGVTGTVVLSSVICICKRIINVIFQVSVYCFSLKNMAIKISRKC